MTVFFLSSFADPVVVVVFVVLGVFAVVINTVSDVLQLPPFESFRLQEGLSGLQRGPQSRKTSVYEAAEKDEN